MQTAAKSIRKLRNTPNPPSLTTLFHSTSLSLARSNRKSDATEPRIRFSVREKRPNAIRSLKNSLLDEYSPIHRTQTTDENSAARDEDIGSRRKDGLHSHRKNSNRSSSGGGKHNAGKRWKSKKQLYDEDDYDERPEKTFTLNIDGQKCYTWSFGSWANFQSSSSDFKSSDDAKSEKAKKRIWNESDVEDEADDTDIGSHSHRVALGLPSTGPLKLDDVKCAFRASALKWHPDKHHGPSRVTAEEKFKSCVDAYNSLCNALKSA